MDAETERLTVKGSSADAVTLVSLDELASRIADEHDQFSKSVKTGLEHAIAAGHLLKRVKDTLSRGKWLDWIGKNCPFSQRTAADYMRLAEHETTVRASSQHAANLTIRAMLALLRPEQKPRKTSTVRSEGSRSPETAHTLEGWLNKIEMLFDDIPPECKFLALTAHGTDPAVSALLEPLVSSMEASGCTALRRNHMLIVTRSDEKKGNPAGIIARSDDPAGSPFESELPVSEMVDVDLPYLMPSEDA